MSLPDLLQALDELGVRLHVRLKVVALKGAVTPELRSAIDAHKNLILHSLIQERIWADLSTWRWGGADASPGIDNPGRGPSLGSPAFAVQTEKTQVENDPTPDR